MLPRNELFKNFHNNESSRYVHLSFTLSTFLIFPFQNNRNFFPTKRNIVWFNYPVWSNNLFHERPTIRKLLLRNDYVFFFFLLNETNITVVLNLRFFWIFIFMCLYKKFLWIVDEIVYINIHENTLENTWLLNYDFFIS